MRGFNSIRLRPIWLSAIVVASTLGTSFAQTVDMLEIEPDSRSFGMGYTGVSLSGNANSTFWNPAALVGHEGAQVSLNRFEIAPGWFDIMLNDVVIRYQPTRGGAVAAGVRYLNWGPPDCRAETPNCMNESWDLALAVSYALKINRTVSLGSSLKYVYLQRWAGDYRPDLPDAVPGKGVALDIGGRFESGYTDVLGRKSIISIGANLANIGPDIRYGRALEVDAKLPMYLRFGWAVFTKLDAVRSIEIVNEVKLPLVHRYQDVEGRPSLLDRIAVGFGAEYVPDDLLVFRAGFQAGEYLYSITDRQVVTFGVGLRHKILRIDAAYATGVWTKQPTVGKVRFTLGFVV